MWLRERAVVPEVCAHEGLGLGEEREASMAKSAKVVKHPTSERRFREVWGRLTALRAAHQVAERTLWAGVLARNFTREEFGLIAEFMSPYDRDLLAQIDANRSPASKGVTRIPYDSRAEGSK